MSAEIFIVAFQLFVYGEQRDIQIFIYISSSPWQLTIKRIATGVINLANILYAHMHVRNVQTHPQTIHE